MISVEWKSRIHQYFLYTMSQKSGTARKSGLLYTGAVGTLEKFSFLQTGSCTYAQAIKHPV
ncbi:hypothetical protein DXD17_07440 [[Ruminococcus] lactaris]|uniref:Uncharacterized protein n=2 Tax=[Ruminococcus] lactaris TaxID=46228 RepID=B5CPV9_9FIRM|nr:hypothetical protein RUMLAC_01503 [[Ruminococcus] lactaris ATCC 29176]RGK40122.1 hypothetical protein DXD17_07440 [[Ruminococcus] lactaris]RHF61896.1 hypothetical protein DW672_05240 [[Ruminococcus] lactaris]RHJ62223.1 hypothetical protein DW116_05760 [[Ruminococcus] lactaris]